MFRYNKGDMILLRVNPGFNAPLVNIRVGALPSAQLRLMELL